MMFRIYPFKMCYDAVPRDIVMAVVGQVDAPKPVPVTIGWRIIPRHISTMEIVPIFLEYGDRYLDIAVELEPTEKRSQVLVGRLPHSHQLQ